MHEQIYFAEKILGALERKSALRFLQGMANRICVGNVRYGVPNSAKKYMTRLELELKAYKKTGNREHLMNIAVYCWLEDATPENKKYHFDPTVDSVTRGKVK